MLGYISYGVGITTQALCSPFLGKQLGKLHPYSTLVRLALLDLYPEDSTIGFRGSYFVLQAPGWGQSTDRNSHRDHHVDLSHLHDVIEEISCSLDPRASQHMAYLFQAASSALAKLRQSYERKYIRSQDAHYLVTMGNLESFISKLQGAELSGAQLPHMAGDKRTQIPKGTQSLLSNLFEQLALTRIFSPTWYSACESIEVQLREIEDPSSLSQGEEAQVDKEGFSLQNAARLQEEEFCMSVYRRLAELEKCSQ